MRIEITWRPNGRILPTPFERNIMSDAVKAAAEEILQGSYLDWRMSSVGQAITRSVTGIV